MNYRSTSDRLEEAGGVGLQYGVIGILDFMREPRAGVVPPLCNFDAMGFSLDLESVGVSSTSRRNWVLFMTS